MLLDSPYPDNLPKVGCCLECNRGASLDEEYLACFVEVAACGTADVEAVARPNLQRILRRKPALAHRFKESLSVDLFDEPTLVPEGNRIARVVLKLARGHVAFECTELRLEEPVHLNFAPVSAWDRQAFEAPIETVVFSEVGSRAMQRWFEAPGDAWIIVQEGRYRYLVTANGAVVRGVLSDYLAFEVIW